MSEQKCPRCGKLYKEYSALSRKDNKTEICPDCGKDEAIWAWVQHLAEKSGNKDLDIDVIEKKFVNEVLKNE